MNPFDMGGLGGMLGGLQAKMEAIKKEAAATEVEGQAGGGLVRVIATCEHHIVSIKIDPKVAQDTEMLEDLIRAATNEAIRKGKAEMAQQLGALTAGLPIPPGMFPGL